jgi:hypothetical protein
MFRFRFGSPHLKLKSLFCRYRTKERKLKTAEKHACQFGFGGFPFLG